MIAQINMRKGTSAEWSAASPVVLLAGESGYDTTLKRYKVGDGETEWANLEWNTLWSRPVGCIYESTVSTSPATLFGGTWSAFGSGRVLVGIDPTQTEFNTVEKEGGSKTDDHYHSLPFGFGDGHFWIPSSPATGQTERSGSVIWIDPTAGPSPLSYDTDNTYNATIDTLQPYIVVYRWVRTA
jgi:hypothetical protein